MRVGKTALTSHKGDRQEYTAIGRQRTPQEWCVPLKLSPLPDKGSEKELWVDPVAFVQPLSGWVLAQWAIRSA